MTAGHVARDLARAPRHAGQSRPWLEGRMASGILSLAVLAAAATSAAARVLVTQERALAEAFPSAAVERRTAFLTEDQARKAEQLAGSSLSTRVISYYAATRDGAPAGTAYFDTHLVRTLPETLMIVVDPSGSIAKIEVLSFDEPPDYLPRPRWFEQFRGRRLDGELAPGRAIPLVTGATISSRAATAAARRALAVHAVLREMQREAPAAEGAR